jgi:hypothetical protein
MNKVQKPSNSALVIVILAGHVSQMGKQFVHAILMQKQTSLTNTMETDINLSSTTELNALKCD